MGKFDDLKINQPKRTPSHKTKSHIVKTKVNGKVICIVEFTCALVDGSAK